jgi:uncharacterized protein (DUF779 family)
VVTELRVTDGAAAAIRAVRAARRGVLTITIDGGCCEGTAPHLYEDYVVPAGAVEIGRIDGIAVFVPGHFGEQYAATRVTLDVIDDPMSDALSLETSQGKRLVMRQEKTDGRHAAGPLET